MKKRYIYFVIVIVLIIGIYLYYSKRANNYCIEYDKSGYKVVESFNKDNNLYTFKLTKDEYIFYYSLNHKYTSKRMILKSIDEKELDNDVKCLNIKVFGDNQGYICSNKKEYTDEFISGLTENKDKSKKFKTSEDVDLYTKKPIYEWNGYGFTNLKTGKKFNVLNKESYDNKLAYQFDKYILFANYDDTNEFTKLYVFNIDKEKIFVIKLDNSISFDSYFEGVIDGWVYLFDRNNNVQYAINPAKKSVKVTSNSESAVYYNNEKTTSALNNFKYKDMTFIDEKTYNYSIKDNNLYLNFKGSDINIKVFNKVNYIINADDKRVAFLSNNEVYEYEFGKGYKLLAKSLEWEFHYNSQLYVFNW